MNHEGHEDHEDPAALGGNMPFGDIEGLEREERIAAQIVASGLRVHQELGPGLLESAYEQCLAFELAERGVALERQMSMPIVYKGRRLDVGYRLDLLVDSCIVVEVKAVEAVQEIHKAQLLTYLRLSRCRLGFLMNFNMKLFKTGLQRIVL